MASTNLIETEASKAIFNRIWSHTVGIVNENEKERQVVKSSDGRRFEAPRPGTASLIRWGPHYCILTAEHVIQGAGAKDLRFFIGVNSLKEQSRQEVEKQGRVQAYPPQPAEICSILRCAWEDMAVLTVAPKHLKAELHTLKSAWADPQEGAIIHSLGFPTYDPLLLEVTQTGEQEQRTIGLTPTAWDGMVVPAPSPWYDSSFDKNPYDSEKHFLAEWRPTNPGMGLAGFSGAAAWTLAAIPTGELWSTKLLFAGMCTNYYRDKGLGRMIKASVVLKFLEEALGAGVTV